jgi:hypothetical protein
MVTSMVSLKTNEQDFPGEVWIKDQQHVADGLNITDDTGIFSLFKMVLYVFPLPNPYNPSIKS